MRSHSFFYTTPRHLVAIILLLAIPFVFLLFFSNITRIDAWQLVGNLGISFARLLVAYVIAVVIAWICAAAFYKGRRGKVSLPIFDALQSFPTFAVLPMAVYFWGPSNTTVVFFLILTIIWPIFFSIVSSLKRIKRDWSEAVAVSGIRGFRYIRTYLFPISIPGLVTGSIVGLGEGWESLIATEIVVQLKPGLGDFFQTHTSNVTVTALGIIGLLLAIFVINKIIWLPLMQWSHDVIEE